MEIALQKTEYLSGSFLIYQIKINYVDVFHSQLIVLFIVITLIKERILTELFNMKEQ